MTPLDPLVWRSFSLISDYVPVTYAWSRVVAILSLAGCAFNIITTVYLKIHTTSIGKMVIALSLMDIIFSFSAILLAIQVSTHLTCFWSGTIVIFGWMGSILWTCCFAHCLLQTIKNHDNDTPDKYLKTYTVLTIAGCILWTPLILFVKFTNLEYTGGYCYNSPLTYTKSILWSDIIIFQAPMIVSVVYCIICYLLVIKELRQFSSHLFLELMIYPLILIICNMPAGVCRAILTYAEDDSIIPFWLRVTIGVILRCQGFFNAFAYGLSQRIIDGYGMKCRRKKKIFSLLSVGSGSQDSLPPPSFLVT